MPCHPDRVRKNYEDTPPARPTWSVGCLAGDHPWIFDAFGNALHCELCGAVIRYQMLPDTA
jgi:hypothetical protein